ncbi:putative membrane protein YuiD [Glycine soja]|nr:putative membrane protein YuiD [Glycine soja]
MPSSHSATVTALAAAIGLQEGFGGPLFATALVFACIVMYDATGLRLQAGPQAEVIVGGILGLLTPIGLLRPVTKN